MRLIDADALIEILGTAIRNMQGVVKFIGAEDDPELKMEIKAYTDILNGVKEQPTIEPEPQWIPCSKRLPHTNGVYNVTRTISDGFECRNISDSCYFDGANTWHDDTRVNHERRYLTDVIAWKPLPEPYQEEVDNG